MNPAQAISATSLRIKNGRCYVKKSEWTFDRDFVGIEELCRAAIKDQDLFQYIHINEDGIRSAIEKGVREIPGIKIYQEGARRERNG
jgi:hypothetical protein